MSEVKKRIELIHQIKINLLEFRKLTITYELMLSSLQKRIVIGVLLFILLGVVNFIYGLHDGYSNPLIINVLVTILPIYSILYIITMFTYIGGIKRAKESTIMKHNAHIATFNSLEPSDSNNSINTILSLINSDLDGYARRDDKKLCINGHVFMDINASIKAMNMVEEEYKKDTDLWRKPNFDLLLLF